MTALVRDAKIKSDGERTSPLLPCNNGMNAEHSNQSREVDGPLFVPGYAERYLPEP